MNESLQEAVQQFNQGDYYACHDTLEALWMEAGDPERRFYQGLLQIAVGYYHFTNNNWRGCLIVLGEGIAKLSDYYPSFLELEMESFVKANQANLTELQQLGAERLGEFDKKRIPSLVMEK